MAKMATFIQKRAKIVPEKILRNPDGTPRVEPARVDYTGYTQAELVALVKANTGDFFQVPESHAEQVVRRNDTYQEVDYDSLSKAAFPTRNKTNTSGPAAK